MIDPSVFLYPCTLSYKLVWSMEAIKSLDILGFLAPAPSSHQLLSSLGNYLSWKSFTFLFPSHVITKGVPSTLDILTHIKVDY